MSRAELIDITRSRSLTLNDLINNLRDDVVNDLCIQFSKLPSLQESDTTIVYTDGGCTKNGKAKALAGYSVYFTEDDSRNVTSLLPDNLQNTNNIAELYAIKRALELSKKKVIVYSDSLYSIKCIETWSKAWAKNGWKTTKGQDVKNKELIQEIVAVYNTMDVTFKHVKAHLTEPNDKLSNEWKIWNGNYQCDKNVSNLLHSDTKWDVGVKPKSSH